MTKVTFGGKGLIPLAGLLAGVAICIGLPAVVLVYGRHLHAAVQTTIIIIGILLGAPVSFIAAFFGIVIPSKVDDSDDRKRHERSREPADADDKLDASE